MGEIGMKNRVLALIRNSPGASAMDLIEKSGVPPGTFYKYKKILRQKDLI
jgi:DNA-binding IclR family transcriptional regulator